jgi:hypothetical protein
MLQKSCVEDTLGQKISMGGISDDKVYKGSNLILKEDIVHMTSGYMENGRRKNV